MQISVKAIVAAPSAIASLYSPTTAVITANMIDTTIIDSNTGNSRIKNLILTISLRSQKNYTSKITASITGFLPVLSYIR